MDDYDDYDFNVSFKFYDPYYELSDLFSCYLELIILLFFDGLLSVFI